MEAVGADLKTIERESDYFTALYNTVLEAIAALDHVVLVLDAVDEQTGKTSAEELLEVIGGVRTQLTILELAVGPVAATLAQQAEGFIEGVASPLQEYTTTAMLGPQRAIKSLRQLTEPAAETLAIVVEGIANLATLDEAWETLEAGLAIHSTGVLDAMEAYSAGAANLLRTYSSDAATTLETMDVDQALMRDVAEELPELLHSMHNQVCVAGALCGSTLMERRLAQVHAILSQWRSGFVALGRFADGFDALAADTRQLRISAHAARAPLQASLLMLTAAHTEQAVGSAQSWRHVADALPFDPLLIPVATSFESTRRVIDKITAAASSDLFQQLRAIRELRLSLTELEALGGVAAGVAEAFEAAQPAFDDAVGVLTTVQLSLGPVAEHVDKLHWYTQLGDVFYRQRLQWRLGNIDGLVARIDANKGEIDKANTGFRKIINDIAAVVGIPPQFHDLAPAEEFAYCGESGWQDEEGNGVELCMRSVEREAELYKELFFPTKFTR